MDGSIVFPTRLATGHRPPNLLRQTTRHEVAVAAVSARYLAAGFEWARDRKPEAFLDHQADGVASRDGRIDLVEIELTPKSWQRYKQILANHSSRLEMGDVSSIAYFCTSRADRAVRRESDRFMFQRDRELLVSAVTFDEGGAWIAESTVVNLPVAALHE
ncbi:MAG TPA: hypothetical protein VHZ81_06130 [Galbitalea sp.]|nr:hypothetical protein [Galbitalea sp.]